MLPVLKISAKFDIVRARSYQAVIAPPNARNPASRKIKMKNKSKAKNLLDQRRNLLRNR